MYFLFYLQVCESGMGFSNIVLIYFFKSSSATRLEFFYLKLFCFLFIFIFFFFPSFFSIYLDQKDSLVTTPLLDVSPTYYIRLKIHNCFKLFSALPSFVNFHYISLSNIFFFFSLCQFTTTNFCVVFN